jgi:hypothetical protein
MLLPMRRVVIVLVGALAVPGGGRESASAPEIATLRSTGAQAAPSADVQDRRPLDRADTSKEERGRLKRQDYAEYSDRYRAFLKCLRDAGVDVSANGDGPLIKVNHPGDSFDDRVTRIPSNCARTTEFQ